MIESMEQTRESRKGHVGRNLTTHSTEARVSWFLTVKLSIPALIARSVNSGVMPQELNLD
jgi:hypothetical protein